MSLSFAVMFKPIFGHIDSVKLTSLKFRKTGQKIGKTTEFIFFNFSINFTWLTPGRVVSFFTTVGAFVFFCRGIDLGTIHKWCNTHQSFLSPPSSMSSLYALSHCPGVMPLRTLPPLKRDFYLLLKKKSKTMFSSHHTSLVVSMLENNQKKKFFFNTFCVDLFPIVWVWAPCSAHPYLRDPSHALLINLLCEQTRCINQLCVIICFYKPWHHWYLHNKHIMLKYTTGW